MLARLLQRREGPAAAAPSRREGLSSADRILCDEAKGRDDVVFVEACRRAFDAIDADRGGSLSASELRDALQRLAVTGDRGEAASEADADAMLIAADADADGEIDFGNLIRRSCAGNLSSSAFSHDRPPPHMTAHHTMPY